MKILITGSSGMLGTDLCGILAEDHDIVGVDIMRSREINIESFYPVNMSDPGSVQGVLVTEAPDLIIHTAAWADVDGCENDPDKAEKMNVEVTANVAQAASKCGASMVYISTDYVFDGNKKDPYKENDLPAPLNIYGRTKLEGEKIVRETLKSYVILRTSWLYGRYGNNFVKTIIRLGEKNDHLEVVEDQVSSPTYTRDLAAALIDVIASGGVNGKEILHISNSGQCSWCEFAKVILDLENINIPVKGISSEQCGRPARRPAFSVLDNGRLRELTGKTLRPWQDALKDYLSEREKSLG